MKAIRKTNVLLLIMVFFLFTLVRFPVSLAAAWFLPEAIEIEGAEGSIWEGHASNLGWQGRVVQKNLAWSFQPGALFKGVLFWQIRGKMNECTSQASLAITHAGPSLSNIKACLPAEPFFNHDAMLRPLRLGGDMKISANHLSLQRQADVSINIQNLFSSLIPDAGILGNMQIKLSVKEQQAQWSVTSSPGLMAVNGQGGGAFNKKLTGKLHLTLAPELVERMGPLLSGLQKEADGQYMLTLKN